MNRLPFPSHPQLPDSWTQALERYTNERIETGGFLRAVLENDLRCAFKRTIPGSEHQLRALIDYCFEHLPRRAWGTPDAVRLWLEEKRNA